MARSKRNEFVAGLFILVSIAVLVVILVMVGNWSALYQARTAYFVKFEQAPMIKAGSAVRFKGQDVGRVESVDLRWRVVDETTGSRQYFYTLELEIPATIELRRDAQISIESPPIGETAWVNISSVGQGELAKDTAREPLVGHGGDMIQALLEAIGVSDEQKKQISDTIANMAAITASLRETAPKLREVTENMAAVTSDLRERMPEVITKVDDTAAKMKSAASRVDGILAENRENLKAAIDNVADLTQSARQRAEELLENLTVASGDIRSLVAANRMNVTDTMVNMRETSEQLKAASEEIRRAPWRLIHKPDEREADTLNVFDASRNYATAVADLNSLAATLKAMLDMKAEGAPVDPELIRGMLDRLKAAFQRYGEAEDALWKEWGKAGQ